MERDETRPSTAPPQRTISTGRRWRRNGIARCSAQAFLKALGELSSQAKHPELATVPWALWGHSGGGIWSDVMTTLYPERVATVFLRSGSFRNRPDFPQPETPAAAYAVPVMGNAGVREQERNAWITTLARAREYRSKG